MTPLARFARSGRIVLSALLMAAATIGVRTTFDHQSTTPGDAGRVVRRFDEPDAAATYYAARRAPLAPSTDVRERYRTARERVERMPRFATVGNLRLPSLRDARASGPALVWPSAGDPAGTRLAASLDAWTPLGPGNIGGRTRVLRFDPANPNRMYAGGVSGGVWKTEDAGANWRPVGDALANLAVNSMVISPSNPSLLIVGTGEGYFREDVRYTGLPLRGGGIFTSPDAGETWTHLPATAGADFHFVNDLLMSRRDERVLYAATRTGVWRTRDLGQTWQRILQTTVRGGCLDLALRTDRPEDILFAACGTFEQATVYRTLDAGGAAAFEPVLSDPGMGRTTLAIAPSRQDVIYALTASNLPGPYGAFEQGLHAVFRSAEGGAPGSWSAQVRNTDTVKLRTLILTNPIAASYRDCGMDTVNSWVTMGWYVASLAVDPADPETVWAAGVDWFRSRDGGRTWGVVSEWWDSSVRAFVHADQHDLVFHPGYNGTTNQQAFALTDGGVFRTDNARGNDSRDLCRPSSIQVSWTELNHNFGVTQFYHGLPLPDGAAYLGGTQDNGTLAGEAARGSDGWQRIYGGDGGYVAIDAADPRRVFVETQWANIQQSDDGGRTFVAAGQGLEPRIGDGLRGERGTFLFITPLVADPRRSGTLWTGGRYIFRRTGSDAGGEDDAGDADQRDDRSKGNEPPPPGPRGGAGGGVWHRASDELRDGALVSAIAVSSADPGRVAAGTTDGWVHVTDDGRLASGLVRWDAERPRPGWVTSLAFDPVDPDVLYATYGGFGGAHVFASTNGGRTWRSVDGAGDTGVPDVPVHAIAVDPGNPDRVYLGTDVGVLVSHARGDVWAFENSGFGAIVTEWLAPLTTPNGERWLFAFTHGRGVWKARLH